MSATKLTKLIFFATIIIFGFGFITVYLNNQPMDTTNALLRVISFVLLIVTGISFIYYYNKDENTMRDQV